MMNTRLLRSMFGLVLVLSACTPFLAPRSSPQPLPSPSGDWTVSLTQSGGFVGVSLKVEVSSNGQLKAEDQRSGRTVTKSVPPETLYKLAQLHAAALVAKPAPAHSGCADCFLYDLQLDSAGKFVQIKADDTTLSDSGAAELVGLLQQLRDDALRSQP